MRSLSAAGAALLLSTAISQAAVVDLTYTFEAEVAQYNFNDIVGIGFPQPDISVGDTSTFVIGYTLDTDFTRGNEDGFYNDGYTDFDRDTGAVRFFVQNSADEIEEYRFNADGTGSFVDFNAYAGTLVAERINYAITSWSVEGLPDIAPVPLPASLPLLAAGLGAIGLFRRKA